MRAYWLPLAIWVLDGILFICILIPSIIYTIVYKEATEYAQQHCASYKTLESTVWDAILSPAFWTAAATIAIAWFTHRLKQSTDRLWEAGDKQRRLYEEEFIATQRPKLIVREVYLFIPTPTRRTPEVRYVVANSGSGRAEIVESHVEIRLVNNFILMPLQPTVGANPIGRFVIEAGGDIIMECGSTIGFAEFQNERSRQCYNHEDRRTNFWFRGFIIYIDKNNLRRKTAFCRGYDFKDSRFRVADDPDYEYVD